MLYVVFPFSGLPSSVKKDFERVAKEKKSVATYIKVILIHCIFIAESCAIDYENDPKTSVAVLISYLITHFFQKLLLE